MVVVNPTLSVITLNVNGLNTPVKIQRLPEQILKMLQLLAGQKRYFIFKDTNRLRKKRMEKIDHARNNQKRGRVDILILEKKWT